MWWRLGTLARPTTAATFSTIILVLAIFATAPTAAHPGISSPDASDGRIQGESYTGYASWCHPTNDGEHTKVNTAGSADEGAYAFGPNSGCFLRYDDVTFDAWTRIPTYRVVAGCDANVTTDVEVRLYGEKLHGKLVAEDRHRSQPCTGEFHNATFDSSIRFPPGTYDIVYSWEIVEGERYYNMNLDYLHVGTEDGPTGITPDGVLEGELFDADDPRCDPTFDGERSLAKQHPDANNGWFAFAGESGCSLTFDDVEFPKDASFDSLRMMGPGCGAAGVTTQVEVLVDGVLVATTGHVSQSDCEGWTTEEMDRSGTVLAGNHDVTVRWDILQGATWYNFNLDHLQLELGGSLVGDTCGSVFAEHICDRVPR